MMKPAPPIAVEISCPVVVVNKQRQKKGLQPTRARQVKTRSRFRSHLCDRHRRRVRNSTGQLSAPQSAAADLLLNDPVNDG
jgi:hypothetical protein